ncbi:MAG: hypothetical protein AAGA24_05110 [Pseudomonadota bacterium]
MTYPLVSAQVRTKKAANWACSGVICGVAAPRPEFQFPGLKLVDNMLGLLRLAF